MQTEEIQSVKPGIFALLSYVATWINFLFNVVRMRVLTARLIRGALGYPNDHNLGNLIQFRHRLRTGLYELENADVPDREAFRNSRSARIICTELYRDIGRLDQAIITTESLLNHAEGRTGKDAA